MQLADNGPGTREDIRMRVFEPFFIAKELGRGIRRELGITNKKVNLAGLIAAFLKAPDRQPIPAWRPAHENSFTERTKRDIISI